MYQLRDLGGSAAEAAEKLQTLPPSVVLERLAVQPVVGPSTIAVPAPGTTGPAPSVNYGYGNGGPTTGHPGVVMLLAKGIGKNDFVPVCTGTLVRQNVILTAAHCVCWSEHAEDNYPTGEVCNKGDGMRPPAALNDPANWRVFFQHAGVREVTRVITNEQYQFGENGVRNDLALLVLSKPVREIMPAKLPASASSAAAWQKGEIVGFGYSSIGANGSIVRSTVLEGLTWPGLKSQGDVSSSRCEGFSYLDPAVNLCSLFAPDRGGSTTTVCSGDSGGPLRLYDSDSTAIGVTSGRSDGNCTSGGTVAFQMAISYSVHRDWIERNLNSVGVATVPGRWPTFGENLMGVIDRRYAVPFAKDGSYNSEGWMKDAGGHKVLATINSTGPIRRFEVQDRRGKALCKGQAGAAGHISQIDYCVASIPLGMQYRIVAIGNPEELLQYTVTSQ